MISALMPTYLLAEFYEFHTQGLYKQCHGLALIYSLQ